MNSKIIVTLIILIIVAGGGYWLYQSQTPASTGTPTPPPAAAPPVASGGSGQAAVTHTISMDASGFAPSALTIRVGDTAVFKNNDTRSRWPASGVHPTHLLCPGFDALQPVAPDQSYSHTFTVAKECPMHDHLIPTLKGKITVTE